VIPMTDSHKNPGAPELDFRTRESTGSNPQSVHSETAP
jgi:hypothetical protein